MALWSSGLYYVIAPEEIGRRSCFLTFNAVLEQKQIACHQLVCFKMLHPDFCCSERFHYFHARLPFEMPPSLVCTLRVTLLVLSQVTASFSPAIGSLQLFPQLSFWLYFYILCLLWQFLFSPACTSPPAPCTANGVKKKPELDYLLPSQVLHHSNRTARQSVASAEHQRGNSAVYFHDVLCLPSLLENSLMWK